MSKFYIESLEESRGWMRRWKGGMWDSIAEAEAKLAEFNFPDADHKQFRIVEREVVVTHKVVAHLRFMGTTNEEIAANAIAYHTPPGDSRLSPDRNLEVPE